MIKIYGISNCDKCRDAKRWLDRNQIDYQFIDLRKNGLSPEQIENWILNVGVDVLVNRRGTTWRNLPDAIKFNFEKQNIPDLLAASPTLIKRPVFEVGATIQVGFNEQVISSLV